MCRQGGLGGGGVMCRESKVRTEINSDTFLAGSEM